MATPGLWVRLKTYCTTNEVDTRHPRGFPERVAREYPGEIDLVTKRIAAAMRGLGWSEVRVHHAHAPEQTWVCAVVVSTLWKFKDDVRVDLERVEPTGVLVHLRSASRVGRADFGANTRHLVALFQRVDALANP